MKNFKAVKTKAALTAIAVREGKTLHEVYNSIQEVIDAAWKNPEARERQMQLFPEGKPDPETFIRVMTEQIQQKMMS